MNTRAFNILVFDSGAGGLSISREILKLCPFVDLHYLADKAFFPYGDMDDEKLRSRVLELIAESVDTIKPEVIVIACNTVSTLVLSDLRQTFKDTLFIGVVPAVKPAAKHSSSGAIGVLATPATIQRHYTSELVENHASEKNVYLYGSTPLVHQAEKHLSEMKIEPEILEQELEALLKLSPDNDIDTIVLACTHFPLIRNHLEQLPISRSKALSFVDSGEAIAKRLHSLLIQYYPNQLEQQSRHYKGQIKVRLTGETSQQEVQQRYLDFLS